jgi:hypothetical protein
MRASLAGRTFFWKVMHAKYDPIIAIRLRGAELKAHLRPVDFPADGAGQQSPEIVEAICRAQKAGGFSSAPARLPYPPERT